MNEIWKDVVGYEGRYQVSNIGRVKSLARVVIRRNNVPQHRTERIMNPATDGKGYKRISLSKNAKDSTKKVHRLVAEAFIPNPKNLPQVNHKNCIKYDNRVENLEWCDNSHNQKHAFKHGLNYARKGENANRALLTNKQVCEIKKLLSTGKYYQHEIAKMYNVSQSAISHINIGKTYTNA